MQHPICPGSRGGGGGVGGRFQLTCAFILVHDFQDEDNRLAAIPVANRDKNAFLTDVNFLTNRFILL